MTEPAAGFSSVYRMINASRHSIDITMYEFADSAAEHALAAAAKRGVNVRVILDRRERSLNSAADRFLTEHRVKVVWSSSSFDYTHQKTLVSDQSAAIIMTANLTSRYYATSRDFLVIDSARADVTAIVRVFDADFAHQPTRPGDGRDLVWSPTDSQRQILGVINGARKSLRVYSEEMADTTVDDALISAAKRGVDVSAAARTPAVSTTRCSRDWPEPGCTSRTSAPTAGSTFTGRSWRPTTAPVAGDLSSDQRISPRPPWTAIAN